MAATTGAPGGIAHAFILSNGIYEYYDVPGSNHTHGIGLTQGNLLYGIYTTPSSPDYMGFSLRISDGNLTTLTYPGATATTIAGVNSSGLFVGSFYNGGPNPLAYYYDGTSYFTIMIPGAVSSSAFAISDNNVVVGEYQDGLRTHGFIYDSNILITVDVPGATDDGIAGINSVGQIVGYYIDSQGTQHGFLGTEVPEPAGIALLAFGFVMVHLIYRRRILQRGYSSG